MLSIRILGARIRCLSLPGISHTSINREKNKCCMSKVTTGGKVPAAGALRRADKSGKCRMGFIPEEWFLFLHSKTGVSGPYVLGIVLANYLFSKEIYIMEHEYYGGLSWVIVIYLVTTKLGPAIAAALDKEVDAVVGEYEKGRKDDIQYFNEVIKASEKEQWMAEGQSVLMDAKKENVTMQLEAEYRERSMLVYRGVKNRMDYHVKKYYAEARIQQRWMIQWILKNVMQSITADFEQKALDQAIADLAAAADRSK